MDKQDLAHRNSWVHPSILLFLFCSLTWAAPNPWKSGESLKYEIGWGFITAGDAQLQTAVLPDGKLEFRTLAHNNGSFQSIYPVRDTIITRVRRDDLLPEFFRKVVNEGSYHNHSWVRFSADGAQARLSDTVFTYKNDARRIRRHSDTAVALDSATHCVISAFYHVRTLDLVPGKTQEFNAVSGTKKYVMKVITHRRETIKVKAGTFRCLVVEPVLAGDGIFQAKGKLTLWITDDERRLPVMMKSKIAVGSIYAELTGWEQGENATSALK